MEEERTRDLMIELDRRADGALKLLKREGFDQAQTSARLSRRDEVNIVNNEPSLLRSTEKHSLVLTGLLNKRRASTEITDISEASLSRSIEALFRSAQAAPKDNANRLSGRRFSQIGHGPQNSDIELLTSKAQELLAYRASKCPRVIIEEAQCAQVFSASVTLTSGGTWMKSWIGYYDLAVVATARDGKDVSSVNYTGGQIYEMADWHIVKLFGIGDMLKDAERQIHPRSIEAGFVGDVVLAPNAVADLLRWLLDQVTDNQLIADRSLYRNSIGEQIASPLLSVYSRIPSPGVCPITDDACFMGPMELVRAGRLQTLMPSLYGSRKTRLKHVPSVSGGWCIGAGQSPRAELISGVTRGALVNRLSIGRPAANGDFAGIIKNSFLIENGSVGPALSDVMIAGNMAKMLSDIVGISSERMDSGRSWLPWIRVANLHFS